MPDVKDSKNRGDLLVEVVVELPVPLSMEAKRLVESLQRESPDIGSTSVEELAGLCEWRGIGSAAGVSSRLRSDGGSFRAAIARPEGCHHRDLQIASFACHQIRLLLTGTGTAVVDSSRRKVWSRGRASGDGTDGTGNPST